MSNDTERMQRAMQAIERLQQRLAERQQENREPIAIVGLGCRFPGGENPQAFWELLDRGGDAITRVPDDRWNAEEYHDPEPGRPGKCVTREGGFIGPPQVFDAAFFGISPKEAATLDPQQRLLLEVSWEAMEQGGVVPAHWRGHNVGVFVGISGHDYSQRLLARPLESIDAYLATGNSHSVAAGRLAYTYGFTGPAMSVDTACSSSLVALHVACRSLRSRECDAALAGGVNRLLAPEFSINFSRAQMLAPDGRCKTFSAAADGFSRAEGCGVLLLKRLADATAAGDRVLAVIQGSALNQDGRSAGLTVPNGPSQQAVIRAALKDADLAPAAIDYVEAHGTGTELGDPIEAGALAAVFGETAREAPLLVGSVKTNVGHMEAAAGIGGVIKVVLAMQHNRLPPHLHFDAPSPHIPWPDMPLEVTASGADWPAGKQRYAGVSSFGFSGTNAHVILAAAEATPAAAPAGDQPSVLLLSAKDSDALDALAARYAATLKTSQSWHDTCWSAHQNRSRFNHRVALAAANAAEAVTALENRAPRSGSETAGSPRVAFLFTGQGAQLPGMGRGLYQAQPAFRRAFDRCNAILETLNGPDLVGLLYPELRGLGVPVADLDQTGNAQPAMFALAYALSELWRAWGVQPTAVLGHSVGEFAAAVTAGMFTLEDALGMVLARGRLMEKLPAGGGMAVVFADQPTVSALLPSTMAIAAGNSSGNTVVSGPVAELDRVIAAAGQAGLTSRRLNVSHAFHSSLMAPIVEEFSAVARAVKASSASCAYYSTVDGGRLAQGRIPEGYWARQLVTPVRFADALRDLVSDGIDVVVEIGPQAALLSILKSDARSFDGIALPSLARDKDDSLTFLAAVGGLFEAGMNLEWGGAPGQPFPLPTYAFNRRKHWAGGERYTPPAAQAPEAPGLLQSPVCVARSSDSVFPAHPSLLSVSLWQQHRVFDVAVLPAVAYLDMALQAGSGLTLSEVSFTQALRLDSETRDVQLVTTPADEGSRFEVLSRRNGDWLTHCVGSLSPAVKAIDTTALEAATRACTEEIDVRACYDRLASLGVSYGPDWQLLRQVFIGENQVLARVDALVGHGGGARFHPVVLDACVQAVAALFLNRPEAASYLPARVGRVISHHALDRSGPHHCHIRVSTEGADVDADLSVFDADGRLLLTLQKLKLRAASKAAVLGDSPAADLFYRAHWQKAPRAPALPAPADVVGQLRPALADALAGQEQRAYAAALAALDAYACQQARAIRDAMGDGEAVIDTMRSLWQRITSIAARPLETGSDAERDSLLARYPSAATEFGLLFRCVDAIPAVLRGEREPLDVLFPNGNSDDLARLYGESPGAALMNGQVRDALQRLRATRREPLRVLEVGAGTGGTTRWLLDPEQPDDYLFTDISPLLVEQARERFADQPGMRYQVLDITSDPAGQGIEVGFDVVIAANVLHATPDTVETLERVRGLLTDGGVLLLLETTAQRAWLDLIFGLTTDWWSFADRTLRPDHATLRVPDWLDLLQKHGLSADALTPESPDEALQTLIVAQREAVADQCCVISADGDALGTSLASSLKAGRALSDGVRRVVFVVPVIDGADELASPIDQLLELVRDIGARSPAVRLDIITRGALGDSGSLPIAAAVWGLGRTIELEYPALRCRRIDLDASATAEEQLAWLLGELASRRNGAVRYRSGERSVLRLNRVTSTRLPLPARGAIKLALKERGSPDALELEPCGAVAPSAGEVSIRVAAAGVNFIDVLDTLGMLPFSRDWLGVECAGEIIALGDGVSGFKIGEPVMALAAGSFRSQVNVPAERVAPQPPQLSALETATLPAAYLTAWHALHDVAAVQPGEHVLVHAGTGGTGIAAIRVARLLGARVHATASRAKWPMLRELGIEQPLDSRSPGFGAAVRGFTDGRGVDVILNSLTGDFISEGLRALAPGGRFLEIGKREVWTAEQVRNLRDDVRYQPVDLLGLARISPASIQALFAALQPHFDRGALAPLPRQVFAAPEAPAAMQLLQHAEHRGKVVLDFSSTTTPVRAAASYLITGGLGGLGVATAAWLAAQGARHIVLLGRTVPEKLPGELAELKNAGVELVLQAGDVSQDHEVARAIEACTAMAPLRGVVHAAGVLHDAMLDKLDYAGMEAVLRPKLHGSLVLHRLTCTHALDFFVLYSSAAALLGSPGQGAHVAANSFLDALAAHRRSLGLPALSINWGPWAEIGAAAGDEVGKVLRARGIDTITPSQGLAALGRLMACQDVAQVGVARIDWQQLRRLGADADALFEHLLRKPESAASTIDPAATAGEWRAKLDALPRRRRANVLISLLQRELGRVLRMPDGEKPSATTGFFDMGLDSLMSVELNNRLGLGLGIELNPTVLFQHPNIAALATYIVETHFAENPSAKTQTAETTDNVDAAIADELAALDKLLKQG